MIAMITPAAATIGTTALRENAEYTLLYTEYAVVLAEPVRAGIAVCKLEVTNRPIGTKIAQAISTLVFKTV